MCSAALLIRQMQINSAKKYHLSVIKKKGCYQKRQNAKRISKDVEKVKSYPLLQRMQITSVIMENYGGS
jgi:hypothetical protein